MNIPRLPRLPRPPARANRPSPNRPSLRRRLPRIITESHGSSGGAIFLGLLCLLVAGGFLWQFYSTKEPAPPAPEAPPIAAAPIPQFALPKITATTTSDNAAAPSAETENIQQSDTDTYVKPPPRLEPLPSYNGFTFAQLANATRDRFRDRRWSEHQKRLLEFSRHIIRKKPLSTNTNVLGGEFQQKEFPYALAQVAFLRQIGPENMQHLSDDSTRNAATRLFTEPQLLEKFTNALAPEDNLLEAVRIWAALSSLDKTPAAREQNENLAIALALVHDSKRNHEGHLQTAEATFKYYREKAKKGTLQLYFKFDELLPDELAWAVAPSRFGLDEYEWTQKPHLWTIKAVEGVKFRDERLRTQSNKLLTRFRKTKGFNQIANAYGVIRYESSGHYPKYTMENILRLGGVCANQTDFTIGFARARGVPAANVGGTLPGGVGHAWCLFRGKDSWRVTGGPGNPGAQEGSTFSPQRGRGIAEAHLFLYNDPARKDGKRDTALRLLRAAQVLESIGDLENALKLFEASVHRSPGQLVFWEKWLTALGANKKKVSPDKLALILRDYRKQFAAYPDFYYTSIVENLEVEGLFAQWTDSKVRTFMRERRRQMVKSYPGRFDLVLASIKFEVSQLKKQNQPGQIKTLLQDAIDDFAKKSMRDYERILKSISEITADDSLSRLYATDVFRRLMNVFEKHHFSGRLNIYKLNPATFSPLLKRLQGEERVLRKLSAEFKRINSTRSLHEHADYQCKAVRYNIEGIQKIQGKISKKMVGNP